METVLDIRQIQAILPHRYPFLLVDRITELGPDKVVGRKCVTMNEPFFGGHFPGHPVMPGVLIVEALAQVGAVMACKATNFDPATHVILFLGIDNARFRKAVVPGDVLELSVVPLRKGGKLWKMRGEARVDGVLAAEAEFLATLAPRQDPAGQGAAS